MSAVLFGLPQRVLIGARDELEKSRHMIGSLIHRTDRETTGAGVPKKGGPDARPVPPEPFSFAPTPQGELRRRGETTTFTGSVRFRNDPGTSQTGTGHAGAFKLW
jgi:hypothetical protein